MTIRLDDPRGDPKGDAAVIRTNNRSLRTLISSDDPFPQYQLEADLPVDGREVAYTEFNTDKSITATTVGTAQEVVSAGAVTYEAVPYLIEFFSPNVNPGANNFHLILRDSSTVLGTLADLDGVGPTVPFYVARRLTPSAASHTYNVAGWVAAASTTLVEAGSGGAAGDSATFFPGFIRVTKVPL